MAEESENPAGSTPAEESSTPADTGSMDTQEDTSSGASGDEVTEVGTVTTNGGYVINLSDLGHQTDAADELLCTSQTRSPLNP